MFPICDEQGRVVGFSGRILSGDEKTAKYVNSPETPVFTKSKVFFGLDKSKRAILDAGFAIICEGQLDLIACFMAGVQNVVAPQGTAFTDQHARIITRYAAEIVLCFDSDLAGQRASIRGLDGLLASGFSKQMNISSIAFQPGSPIQDAMLSSGLAIRVVVLPSPHDPDSYIKEFGSQAFSELVSKSESFFDFYLKHLCAVNDVSSDRGKTEVVRSMAEVLRKTGNHILIDYYTQKTAMEIGVGAEAVRSEFKKLSRDKSTTNVVTEEATGPSEEIQPPSAQEFWLLKLLFLHEDLVQWCATLLDSNWIQHSLVRQIVSKRLDAQRVGRWLNFTAFLDECETPEMRNLLTKAVTEDRPIPNPAQQISDVAAKLRNQWIDRQIMSLIHRSNQPETDEATRIALLREQHELRELKRHPLTGPA